MYNRNCFPFWERDKYSFPNATYDDGYSATPLFVKRLVDGNPEEPYSEENPQFAASINGSSVSIDETYALFQLVIHTMCAAERYCMLDLQRYCYYKLMHFPIGAKEVSLFAQLTLTNIPESRTDIYELLQKSIGNQKSRLPHCETLHSWLKNEASESARKFFEMLSVANGSGPATNIEKALDGNLDVPATATKLAICIKDVYVQDTVRVYGPDDEDGICCAGSTCITSHCFGL